MQWSETAQDYKCEYGVISAEFCDKQHCIWYEPEQTLKKMKGWDFGRV